MYVSSTILLYSPPATVLPTSPLQEEHNVAPDEDSSMDSSWDHCFGEEIPVFPFPGPGRLHRTTEADWG